MAFTDTPCITVSHDGSAAMVVRIYNKSKTSFYHENVYASGATVVSGADCMWIAIGH